MERSVGSCKISFSVLYHGTSFYSSGLRYDETEYFALSAVYNCVLRYGAVIVTVNIVYLTLTC